MKDLISAKDVEQLAKLSRTDKRKYYRRVAKQLNVSLEKFEPFKRLIEKKIALHKLERIQKKIEARKIAGVRVEPGVYQVSGDFSGCEVVKVK